MLNFDTMVKRIFLVVASLVFVVWAAKAEIIEKTSSKLDKVEYIEDVIKSSDDAVVLVERLNQLLHEFQQRYTSNSMEYAECLLWCANVCVEYGDNEQGLELLRQSELLFKQYGEGSLGGRDTLAQIFHLDVVSKIENNSGRTYAAVKDALKALKLKKDFFGDSSEVYLMALLDVSRIYAERLSYKKSNNYHNLGFDAYVERIKDEFCSTSESNRITYWTKAAKYIYRTLNLAYKSTGDGVRSGENSLASSAYNALLLSKGLLLNTTRSFADHINNSKNESAIEMLQTRREYVDLQKSQASIDSLDYEIIKILKEAGKDFQIPQLYAGWHDVALKLGGDDLAIEFYKTEEGRYGAILIKRDWKSPKLVRLKEDVVIGRIRMPLEQALKDVSLESYTLERADDLWNVSKAVWTDEIITHFPRTGNGRVYFAADGELQITAIEHFPYVPIARDGAFYAVSDLFAIYRLSSTRELVYKKEGSMVFSAAVYGGLRYDMYYDDMVADAQNYKRREGVVDIIYNDTTKASRSADGFEYLEGTKTEAESIVKTISSLEASTEESVKSYIGVKGTEASFKSLSGQGICLIHVATHGYFFNKNNSRLVELQIEEHPLNRSGLIFSGAENKWCGDILPEGVDDGILTALEISALNFSNLDLVVLSACETGSGSVESDGVFGLQRGFKMASANSIMMSLWKVDDAATCALMKEFYNNWLVQGMSKYEALDQARRFVRAQKEKGWDNPYFWAAFILLDGIS